MALKRLMDIVVSIIAIIILLPVYIGTAIGVMFSSPGPIFYTQPRIGLRGKSFKMIKFRSMYQDAERGGPMLSSKNDTRITKWGKIMRQYRLDEIPQFFSVLKGDMSLVGPRPERQVFIDQIMKEDPRYRYLFQIRPGVTSYATLYNGYTDTLEKMLRRLRYDLFYQEHRSWGFDIKILFMTFMNIVFGKKF